MKSSADPTPRTALALTLGERVREARSQRALSRRALAEASGVSLSYLARLESGDCNISVLLLERLADTLGVRVVDLLTPQSPQAVELALLQPLLQRLPVQELAALRSQLMHQLGEAPVPGHRRVALVGLRGVGKSTVGPLLAQRLARPFVELNRVIEKLAGLPVNEVFMLYGQAGFRSYEKQALEWVVQRHDAVVLATGGGLVAEAGTYQLLLDNFHAVWMRARPEDYWSRVTAQGDRRLTRRKAEVMANLVNILREREPLYRRSPTHVDTSGRSVAEVVDEIAARLSLRMALPQGETAAT
jgi:XRE family transcriptional regulator, aerobic/anaerobic benzoate catabolism transcriptional regulator